MLKTLFYIILAAPLCRLRMKLSESTEIDLHKAFEFHMEHLTPYVQNTLLSIFTPIAFVDGILFCFSNIENVNTESLVQNNLAA